jgi:DnaK suppressor protein
MITTQNIVATSPNASGWISVKTRSPDSGNKKPAKQNANQPKQPTISQTPRELATCTEHGYLQGEGSMALTAKQLKHLEARLLEERSRVLNALAQYHQETSETLQEASGDVSAYHVHMADQGTDTEDQELDAVNAQRETVELAEIDAALERLYQKPAEYGRCERTGKPIPFERLDLVPWARTCD